MLEILLDTLIDSIKLIPFLFLTYLAMEYLEHKAGNKTERMVQRAGKWGPFIGGVVGALPQCGFSAAASGLYAGRVITLGTLIAIYLSTSDEMLPILISKRQPLGLIASILLTKILIGMAAGFVLDFLQRRKGSTVHQHAEHSHGEENQESERCKKENIETDSVIHALCTHDRCGCEKGIFRSAAAHTVQITIFIFLISFVLHLLLHGIGEDALAGLLQNRPVLGPVLAGLVGLIPNCAASVAITQLFLGKVISAGAMMAGLCTGAGVGLLVLFRVNRNKWENLKITGLLYGIGVFAGIVIDCMI